MPVSNQDTHANGIIANISRASADKSIVSVLLNDVKIDFLLMMNIIKPNVIIIIDMVRLIGTKMLIMVAIVVTVAIPKIPANNTFM